ncbi:hypothetical protein FA95DRAFT_108255 [Auriscalpium vulgare]|uniref:Uncharacterized protein n=1 Tax=Auriscalpium vulgare TaxID=40419 RepID=A0ACB8S7U0_9AGAM|nr:hypothetical protein FA95DRAFT_108255 [Auriscalpium vulgare]
MHERRPLLPPQASPVGRLMYDDVGSELGSELIKRCAAVDSSGPPHLDYLPDSESTPPGPAPLSTSSVSPVHLPPISRAALYALRSGNPGRAAMHFPGHASIKLPHAKQRPYEDGHTIVLSLTESADTLGSPSDSGLGSASDVADLLFDMNINPEYCPHSDGAAQCSSLISTLQKRPSPNAKTLPLVVRSRIPRGPHATPLFLVSPLSQPSSRHYLEIYDPALVDNHDGPELLEDGTRKVEVYSRLATLEDRIGALRVADGDGGEARERVRLRMPTAHGCVLHGSGRQSVCSVPALLFRDLSDISTDTNVDTDATRNTAAWMIWTATSVPLTSIPPSAFSAPTWLRLEALVTHAIGICAREAQVAHSLDFGGAKVAWDGEGLQMDLDFTDAGLIDDKQGGEGEECMVAASQTVFRREWVRECAEDAWPE